MKIKKIILTVLSYLFISNAFANPSLYLQSNFAETLTQLTVTPDAFIGKSFPSVVPHFSLGTTVAAVFQKNTTSDNAFQKIMPSPMYGFTARIGGFVLPFDFAVHGTYFKSSILPFLKIENMSYWMVGGDFRFAILQGNNVAPKLSFGIGYLYGNLETETYKYNHHIFFTQLQLSKNISVFTPYIGVRAYIDVLEAKLLFTNPKVLKTTRPQAYGGLGFNFVFFTLNFGGCWSYNIIDNNSLWSANISATFKM